MNKYNKIIKWLGNDYHLSIINNPGKPDRWYLYRYYSNPDLYFSNDNRAIMTSEKHTYKQLYNFAKKSHMVSIPLLNSYTRLGITAITLILATINLFMNNVILRTIIYTSNTIIITEGLIHAWGLCKTAVALEIRAMFNKGEK